LVGLELLAKDAQGRYSLTPESETFLVKGKPGFLGGLFHHSAAEILPKWMQLNEVVLTGQPVMAANEENEGSAFFTQLVEAIFPLSYPPAQTLAEALDVAHAKETIRVLDLAAGSGVWGIALAQKSPHIQVTAVDWAGVIPVTKQVATRFGVADRFRFISGDLMKAEFGNGHHIATLGHILHSEGEERSRTLLRKTFKALAPGGTIAIAEWLVNEDRMGPPHSLIFAVNMLVNTEHGDTYSFGEISRWLKEAGFENSRTLESPGPSPLVLATKPTK
jgi:ubiquinone/menaquinone biosynthesis C-methylase UbiE